MGFDGPSRTIIVEPIRKDTDQPDQPDPVREGEPERGPEKLPAVEPEKTPERVGA